ncbi:hypothetical protein SFUMM280S_10866 [Streptomyces fumanus]
MKRSLHLVESDAPVASGNADGWISVQVPTVSTPASSTARRDRPPPPGGPSARPRTSVYVMKP